DCRQHPPGGDARRRSVARLGRLVGGGRRDDAHLARAGRDADGVPAAAACAVITPRRTRLIRVPDLHVFRRVIASLAPAAAGLHRPVGSGSSRPSQGADVASGFRRTAIIVPTRGAGVELRSWLCRCGTTTDDAVIVTRDGLYETLHGRLREAPRRLTAFERD